MVAELKEQYTFDVEVVKRSETALIKRFLSLKFPSVELDGRMIAELRDVTREELDAAMRQCC